MALLVESLIKKQKRVFGMGLAESVRDCFNFTEQSAPLRGDFISNNAFNQGIESVLERAPLRDGMKSIVAREAELELIGVSPFGIISSGEASQLTGQKRASEKQNMTCRDRRIKNTYRHARLLIAAT